MPIRSVAAAIACSLALAAGYLECLSWPAPSALYGGRYPSRDRVREFLRRHG